MSPTELKKLRMRQRKARKAEERKQEVKRKEEKKAEQKRKQAGQVIINIYFNYTSEPHDVVKYFKKALT